MAPLCYSSLAHIAAWKCKRKSTSCEVDLWYTRRLTFGQPRHLLAASRRAIPESAAMSTTRQRLIDAAVARFYRDGFRNVGLDQILADVGISKTAFYKHFESKDDLMLAVLAHKNQWLQDLLRQTCASRAGRAGGDQLRALFDVVQQFTAADDFHG